MKYSFATTLLLANASSVEAMNRQQTLITVKAFLDGMLTNESLPELDECFVDDPVDVGLKLEDAMVAYKEHTKEGYLRFFNDIGQAFEKVNDALTMCNTKTNDQYRYLLFTLRQFFKEISTPLGLVEHIGIDLLFYNEVIINEMKTSLYALEANDYQQYGYHMGTAIGKLFMGYWWGAPNPTITNGQFQGARILEGIVNKAAGVRGRDDLEHCIDESTTVSQDADDAVKLLLNKNAKDSEKALKLISDCVFQAQAVL